MELLPARTVMSMSALGHGDGGVGGAGGKGTGGIGLVCDALTGGVPSARICPLVRPYRAHCLPNRV
jgi:hypothetical protein